MAIKFIVNVFSIKLADNKMTTNKKICTYLPIVASCTLLITLSACGQPSTMKQTQTEPAVTPTDTQLSSTQLSSEQDVHQTLIHQPINNNDDKNIATTAVKPNTTKANFKEDDEKKIHKNHDFHINTGKTDNQPSILTNDAIIGSPEATIKAALDTLYYGDVADAVQFYHIPDMDDFATQLAHTQTVFKQTIEKITLDNSHYNADKTEVTLNGNMVLKGQDQPISISYQLKKINGKWLIVA